MNQKGIALLVTLALISILMAAALELARRSADSAEMDKRTADRFQAEEMAKSGIDLAMFILTRDAEQNDIDSVQDIWADSEILAAAVQLLGFQQGSLDIVITDELGKIQINALLAQFPGSDINNDQSALWERFLNMVISSDKSVDLRDPAEIINSLKDWLDSGDNDAISGLSGAESYYYEALDPPVVCSNGPVNKVEELFMIKGIPRNLASLPENMTELSKNLTDQFPAISSPSIKSESSLNNPLGLSTSKPLGVSTSLDPSRIFTVYGIDSSKKEGAKFTYPGTININTADVPVLAAMLPPGMEDQASELVSFRMEKEQTGRAFVNALDRGWYKRVIALSPKDNLEFERIARYSSDMFRVDATAQLDDTSVSLTGFIKREKRPKSGRWGCTILQLTAN
ncbi:MAG: general secretion pathway protein GspK [Desulfamplus sp.]|nr:general secretion pathway protein GspK [Desulfamplus sp.]